LGKGVRTAPRDALIADSVAAGKRGFSFGIHRAADSAGALFGLLVAIAIVWTVQADDWGLSAEAFRRVVLWASIPATLAVVVVLIGVRETDRPKPSDPPRLTLSGLGSPFRRFLAVIVLFSLGNSSDAFLVLRAQSIGSSVIVILGMIALHNLVYTVAAGPLGALSDRIHRRGLVVAGWLLYAVVYIGFATASQTWLLWLVYSAYGLYYAMTEGVAKAFVADLVPADRRGTAYGVFAAAVGLTALPASLVAGLLWQGVGPAAPFLFGGALAVASAALLHEWV
jgi:MFS family permease